MHILQSWAS